MQRSCSTLAVISMVAALVLPGEAAAGDLAYGSYADWYNNEGYCYRHNEFSDNTGTMDARIRTNWRPTPDLDCWLRWAHPEVAAALIFVPNSAQGPLRYVDWTPQQRADLWAAFDWYWWWFEEEYQTTTDLWSLSNFAAPTNISSNSGGTVLSLTDGWRYYVNSVAISLAAELGHWYRWSIRPYQPVYVGGGKTYTQSDPQLPHLFDSRWMFYYDAINSPPGYRILSSFGMATGNPTTDYYHGDATPSSPALMLEWTRALFVQSSIDATINKALTWGQNLTHSRTTNTTYNDYWQYSGSPPVERVMRGTTSTDVLSAPNGLRHYTSGCHATYGIYKILLRTMNIVVMPRSTPDVAADGTAHWARHSQMWFPAVARGLSHNDDLNNALYRDPRTGPSPNTPLPVQNIMVSAQQWNTYFGSSSVRQNAANIGSGAVRALLCAGQRATLGYSCRIGSTYLNYQNMPRFVMAQHCRDLAAGRSHAQSNVYNENFVVTDLMGQQVRPGMSLASVEQVGLWTAITKKLNETPGGCSAYLP